MAADMVVGVTETVPRFGLAEAGAEVLLHFQRPPAVMQSLLTVAEEGVEPADRVERPGLPGPVAGRAEQLQGAAGVANRLTMRALPFQHPSEIAVYMRLADGVARA